ncbi:dipeptidase PepV [Anaerotruncus sp. 80]|uniref:Dipeptidase PepV n=1 Tax=Anaerotruncus colihominis TaxID=169435 RepID=A0A845QL20_9FIRM|nr:MULTISPECIES: dipeptidase PepV [Anaerotruncus]NBH61397.1 dipeptidase PepV [Anaerotruncus colihominis]NCF02052.1 dipeptidase PepV [Anaerotruncus sp. 80]
MKREFEKFYEENRGALLGDISALIEIPSIATQSDDCSAPFGKDVADCLAKILQRGEEMGLHTENIGNYIGEITLGEGNHLIGILCHADVVDAGEGWETEPFKGIIKDGEMYGRGSIDDKGPMVCCMYAMKYIKENNLLPPDFRLKMVIGTDEEVEWNSIARYLEGKPELPEISIVPDANFPVIFCEKGLINADLSYPVINEGGAAKASLSLQELCGGERANVVPTGARCKISWTDESIRAEKLIEEISAHAEKLGAETGVCLTKEGEVFVEVKGRAAHAMTPEKGVNAISALMEILYLLSEGERYIFVQQNLIEKYHTYIGLDYNGERMGIGWEDEASGLMTVNVGLMKMEKDALTLTMNIRYPVTKTFEDVDAKLKPLTRALNGKLEYGVCMDPIYFEKDSEIVKTLMKVYQDATGDMQSQPISLGGATYARAIPNAIAFGPVFPDQEELAHEANEHYSVADYERITEIYANALLELCKTIK